MTTPPHWFRLAVDLDPAFNVRGSHFSLHRGRETISEVVRQMDGPFDSAVDVFGYVLDDVAARYGVSLSLDSMVDSETL